MVHELLNVRTTALEQPVNIPLCTVYVITDEIVVDCSSCGAFFDRILDMESCGPCR